MIDILEYLKEIEDEEDFIPDFEEEANEDKDCVIKDDATAERFIKRYKEVVKETDEAKLYAENYVIDAKQKADKYLDSVTKPLNYQMSYIYNQLKMYASKQRKEGKKSIKYINGTLKFKKSPEKYSYDDDELLKFLKDNGLEDFMNVKVIPKWGELKKNSKLDRNDDDELVMKINNKEISCVSVQEVPEGFYIS